MRNALIFILILGVLVLGFLLIKAKNQNDTRVPWPETEPATPTNNYQNNQNNNQQTDAGNQIFTTYNAQGFSFQYDSSATVQSGVESTGGKYYLVSKPGGVTEIIKMVPASSAFEHCANMEMKSTTMNGKDFVYCNSTAEPATTYIYIEGGNALVIMNQGTIPGLTYSYINPATVEINNQVQNTNQTYTYSNNEFGFYVDIPGRVVTPENRAMSVYEERFFFDRPNQGQQSPRDFYVAIMTPDGWQQQWDNYASTVYQYEGTVSYNGITYNHYTTPAVDPGIDEPQELNFYVTQHDGLYYQIYSIDPSNLNNFGFL